MLAIDAFLLDRCETTVNILGDSMVCRVVAELVGENHSPGGRKGPNDLESVPLVPDTQDH